MEWLATNIDSITAIKDIILSLAALATGFVAISGLTAWRKELKGKSEYTLSKEVLRAVYKVRNGFNHVRNPMMYGYEYPEDAIGLNGMLKPEEEYDAKSYAYQNRWKVLQDAMKELEEKHLEAQVEWGPDKNERIKNIRICAAELQSQIREYLWIERYPNRASWQQTHMNQEQFEQRNRKMMVILYNHDSKGEFGEFTQKINNALNEFEVWLWPKVK